MLHRVVLLAVFLGLATGAPRALAWWDFSHNLTGEIAFAQLTPATRASLATILQAHPRLQADFMDAMPAAIRSSDADTRLSWLLGRAAYWPDLARDFPEPDRSRYNRPTWHYIDGALVRGAANRQGNTYVDLAPFPDRPAGAAATLNSAADVDNVLHALDWNTRVFTDPASSLADKAVALCWILHLGGDIHQPLHTGTAFSPVALERGDSGGNGVPTDQPANLHGRWDGALSDQVYAATLAELLGQTDAASRARLDADNGDWATWMAESRAVLTGGAVYDDAIRDAIRAADAAGGRVQAVTLGPAYIRRMKSIATDRVLQAGLRLGTWLAANTPSVN